MTIAQHAAHGAILTAIVTHNPILIVAGAIIGAWRDIIGYVGHWSLEPEQVHVDTIKKEDETDIYTWKWVYNKSDFSWYLWAHKWHWFIDWLPLSAMHYWIDEIWHNPEPPYGWYSWGLKAEIVCWIVSLIVGYYMFFVHIPFLDLL